MTIVKVKNETKQNKAKPTSTQKLNKTKQKRKKKKRKIRGDVDRTVTLVSHSQAPFQLMDWITTSSSLRELANKLVKKTK